MIHGVENIAKDMPVLFLGEPEAIELIRREVIAGSSDVKYYPEANLHYKEYGACIERIDWNEAVASQNREFIDLLLRTEINFQVVTCYMNENGDSAIRAVTKEDAKHIRYDLGLELR